MSQLSTEDPQQNLHASSTTECSLTCAEYFEGEQVRRLLQLLQRSLEDGRAVSLNLSQVQKTSTLGLQVLLSAKTSAAQRQVQFEIKDPSKAFLRACEETGLSSHMGVGV